MSLPSFCGMFRIRRLSDQMRFSTLSEGIFLFQVHPGKLIRTRVVIDRPYNSDASRFQLPVGLIMISPTRLFCRVRSGHLKFCKFLRTALQRSTSRIALCSRRRLAGGDRYVTSTDINVSNGPMSLSETSRLVPEPGITVS